MSTIKQVRSKQKTSSVVYWEIRQGNGVVGGYDDKYRYDSELDAFESARDFKRDPRRKTPSMTDANVAYWKSQTYKIVKVEKLITEVHTI